MLASALAGEVGGGVAHATGLAAIQRGEVTPLGEVAPRCRGDLEMICAKALARDR